MVYIQLECQALLALCYWSAGTDLVVLTFQLLLDCETVIFFSFLFFYFLSVSNVFFCVFFASLSTLTHSPPPPPPAPDKRERPFVLLQTILSTIRAFLVYAKLVRPVLWSERLCTDWRFSVMETLSVIPNCRWQVKILKVPSNSVWKENIVFSAKKKK